MTLLRRVRLVTLALVVLAGVGLVPAVSSAAPDCAAIRNGADLSFCDLSGRNLAGARLAGADLRGANLSGANLDGANLTGANLSGANLTGASLVGTRLTGANLSGATISEGGLANARTTGANLRGIVTVRSIATLTVVSSTVNNSSFEITVAGEGFSPTRTISVNWRTNNGTINEPLFPDTSGGPGTFTVFVTRSCDGGFGTEATFTATDGVNQAEVTTPLPCQDVCADGSCPVLASPDRPSAAGWAPPTAQTYSTR